MKWIGLSLVLALAATGALAQTAQAALPEDTPIVFPDRGAFGVVVHTPFRAQALKDIGVQWVRISFRWKNCEKGDRGRYEWEATDKMVDYYLDNGFAVMAVLTMEGLCPLYEDDKDNQDLVIDAIARWGGAMAERYKGKGLFYELSNEPEVFPMGGYWSNPVTYTKMARKVSTAIKQADADAKVGALSVAWMDRSFISTALDNGLIADGNIDILTYHGYHRRGMMPESGLAEDVTWLREQIAAHAPEGKYIMPVDSERGYAKVEFLEPKHWGAWRTKTYLESEQAAYCARHYLESIYLGLEVAIWYKDMRGEECFSLYYGTDEDDQGLRPMGHVFRNLAALLPDNPKRLQNRAYAVSLTDPPDDISAPDGQLEVRSYLRETANGPQVIVAAWNPVEAFDGKILDNRKRIGDHYYEAWRAASPDDNVEIPTQVRITGLAAGDVKSMRAYDVLATTTNAAPGEPMAVEEKDGAVLSPELSIGPMPTVLVVEVK